jgi:hypothetical protein
MFTHTPLYPHSSEGWGVRLEDAHPSDGQWSFVISDEGAEWICRLERRMIDFNSLKQTCKGMLWCREHGDQETRAGKPPLSDIASSEGGQGSASALR